MREMKESGIDWIGKIPQKWDTKRLKKVLAERNEKNDPIKSENLLSLSIERGVFPYSEKTGGGNKAKDNFKDYKLAYQNDIVLNSMNVVVGAVGLSKYFGCVSPVYYTLYSRNKEYNINYYSYLFQSTTFQKSLWGLGNGIVVKESDNGKLNTIRMRIPMEKLNNVILPVPPKEEQEEIEKFLNYRIDEIDNVIEKTKKTIEDYKKYKQSITTEAVTKGLNKNVKMKESGIECVGKIPEHWRILRTKFVAKTFLKGSGITKEDVFNDGNIQCVRYGEIYSKYDNYFNKCFSLTNIEKVGKPVYISLGDILFAGTGELVEEIGKNILYEGSKQCLAGGDIIIMKHEQNARFLNYALNSISSQEQKSKGKAKLKVVHISASDIGNILIAIPPKEEQREIANYLDKVYIQINKIIENKQKIVKELEQYKKSLIHEYATGKKEVINSNITKSEELKHIKINCKDNIFAQAILLCRVIEKLNQYNLGRVKAEKTLYLIEKDIGFDFNNNYVREAAGPLSESIYKCESVISNKNKWIKVNKVKKHIEYEILSDFSKYSKYYDKYYSNYDNQIEEIIEKVKNYSTDKSEMVATLYASWNDFLIKKEDVTDIKIVKDVRENWNDTKKRFNEQKWLDVLKEMKEIELTPKGYGNLTTIKEN